MKCLNCGQNHQPEDRFCVQCGAEIIKPDEATQNVPTASTMTEDQQLQSTSKQSQKKDDVNNERQLYKKTTSVHQTTRKRSTLEENDSFVEEITDDNMSSMENFFKDLQIEGKKFFTHVFKSVDDIFENQVTFNYRFLLSLVCIGTLLSTLLIIILSSDLFLFMASSSPLKITFYILMIMLGSTTLSIGVLYSVLKISLNTKVQLHKVVSDFIVVNTFSVITLLIGLILAILGVTKLAIIILVVACVMLYIISPSYILAKYSVMYSTKIASIYSIIIYQLVMTILVYLLGHMIIEQLINDYLMKLWDSGFNGLL